MSLDVCVALVHRVRPGDEREVHKENSNIIGTSFKETGMKYVETKGISSQQRPYFNKESKKNARRNFLKDVCTVSRVSSLND